MLQVHYNYVNFAETLRAIRKESCLKQKTLALSSGVPRNRICEYEKGYRIPSFASFIKLMQALSGLADGNRLDELEESYKRATKKSA